jgi:DNA-binding Lrp family transcriptional regulator
MRKRRIGTPLKVFSGREAKLNRVIFMILDAKKGLTSYGMYLEIRRIKGFRHVKRQSVDRRMKALCEQGWIRKYGVRPAKAHFLSPLYALSVRAQVALCLNKTDLNLFIQVANEIELKTVVNILSVYL